MTSANNSTLAELLREQNYNKLFPFAVRIKNGLRVRTMRIHANTAYYARRMAQCQLEPGDRILSVRAAKGDSIPLILPA